MLYRVITRSRRYPYHLKTLEVRAVSEKMAMEVARRRTKRDVRSAFPMERVKHSRKQRAYHRRRR